MTSRYGRNQWSSEKSRCVCFPLCLLHTSMFLCFTVPVCVFCLCSAYSLSFGCLCQVFLCPLFDFHPSIFISLLPPVQFWLSLTMLPVLFQCFLLTLSSPPSWLGVTCPSLLSSSPSPSLLHPPFLPPPLHSLFLW